MGTCWWHGSWNRSVPTGHKVVRLSVAGGMSVGVENLISGWLFSKESPVHPRPADLIYGPEDGALYISGHKAGVIYRVTKTE